MVTFRLIDNCDNNYYHDLVWGNEEGMINYLSCLTFRTIRYLNRKYKIEKRISENEIKKYCISEFLYNNYLK